MRIVGLFAGIGGIELGFHRALGSAAKTDLLCEWWEPAQNILELRFPDVEIHPDVRELQALPAGIDVLAAGFPCTDLSQAGRTAGINGTQSGLVGHVFEALRLASETGGHLPWLLVENVPNMLALDGGRAMAYLVREMESLGYRWAYRVVDSRFTGVPQRRRRVILLASTTEDPRSVLFSHDAGERPADHYSDELFGFYWTEGRRGLGWAQDATPTLKGGSTIGIPSPPALWVRDAPIERRFVLPTIEDAEALQGFPRGWTDGPDAAVKRGARWKMTGNAVTTRVAEWVARNLSEPGSTAAEWREWTARGAWPSAAWGEGGRVFRVDVSEFPELAPYESLADTVDLRAVKPLSHRAISGFGARLAQGNLGRFPGFREDVSSYADATAVV